MGFNLAWKHLIDSAQTASLVRLFQRGITLGKKEYLYAFEFANICMGICPWFFFSLVMRTFARAGKTFERN